MVELHVIYATDRRSAIGHRGPHPLPWHYPEDLRAFKEITSGHALIMGRHTFESLPGVLPGRPHYVISRSASGMEHSGVTWVRSVEQALQDHARQGGEKAFVIGGQDLINSIQPQADYIHKTVVPTILEGDDLAVVDAIPLTFVSDGIRIATAEDGGVLTFTRWKKVTDAK